MVNIAKTPRWFFEAVIFLFTTGATISLTPHLVLGAQKVTFEYGAVSQSVSIEELEEFAATGETSPSIDTLLEVSNQPPWLMRRILVQKLPANTKLTYDLLNTAPGEYVLSQTSNVVNTRSDRANTLALRGTLVSCASDDNQVSLLEVLQKYPVQQVYVNGKLLSKASGSFRNFINDTRQNIRIPFLSR
ncbi:MAG: hypothetical protein Tsb0014_40570 [Pleurocapsa sp.]